MRRGLALVGALLTSATLLVACGGQAVDAATGSDAPTTAVVGGDWTGFDYDAQRSGVGPADTGITAGNLGQLRLRRVDIDGTVDSAPIELHGVRVRGRTRDVIVVTTTYGKTIAYDAGTGSRLWEFVPRGINLNLGTFQVTTATPIADPGRGFVYSASPDGFIHKLALTTGRQIWARGVTFDAVHEKLASALNISGQWVVVVTGGYLGDAPPYDGHVLTIDRFSGRIVHVWNTECSHRHQLIAPASCPDTNTRGDSAMWARAGAVIEPGSRRILVATGNGPFNGSTDWGGSVLELSPDASRLLHNWTPTNQAQLSANDLDVGSTAPALLPPVDGFRLAVQSGKGGVVDLLNLNRLDGTTAGPGPRLGGQLQQFASAGGNVVVTAPAVWKHAGHTYVFIANDSGTVAYVLRRGRHPRLSVVWQNDTPGTSPVIAGGLLYVYDEADGGVTVRRPLSGFLLKSLPVGTGHWNSPIVVGGRVIVPEGNYQDHATTGVLDIYHLPGR